MCLSFSREDIYTPIGYLSIFLDLKDWRNPSSGTLFYDGYHHCLFFGPIALELVNFRERMI
tara:strand:- start:271 stop:453 length:183 start_codon:yes stop_codon:yes gene_type:complete